MWARLYAIAALVTTMAASPVPASAAAGDQQWASQSPGEFGIAVEAHGDLVFVATANSVFALDANTGDRVWATGQEWLVAMDVSPNGRLVFATGGIGDYVTSAFDAATGRLVWTRRYDGPVRAGSLDVPSDMTTSRDGTTVFVTGRSASWHSASEDGTYYRFDYATVAYRASDGRQLWAQRYGIEGEERSERGYAIAAGGSRVFVTGTDGSYWSPGGYSAATLAYDSRTGARVWLRRGPATKAWPQVNIRDVQVGPDNHVYVAEGTDVAAYDYDGHHLWSTPGEARSLAVSPDGSRVAAQADTYTYQLVAATGVQTWAATFGGAPSGGDFLGQSVAYGPDSSTVFVMGYSGASVPRRAYVATAAYDTTTGVEEWTAMIGGKAAVYNDYSQGALAVDDRGNHVFVTGGSRRAVVVAYDAAGS